MNKKLEKPSYKVSMLNLQILEASFYLHLFTELLKSKDSGNFKSELKLEKPSYKVNMLNLEIVQRMHIRGFMFN